MQAASLRERDAAIESVRGLVWKIIRQHRRRFGGDHEDAYQECVTLLCENWPQYDPAKSAFTTWTMITCERHLRRCHAMGRLGGQSVRVSIHAFERGERVKVFSIHGGDDEHEYQLAAREIKPELGDESVKELDFVQFAESLVDRNLSPLERRILVKRFMADSWLSDIADQEPCTCRQTIGRRIQNFAAEARRRHRANR